MNQIFKKQSVVFTGHRSVPKDKEQEVRQQVRGKIRLLFSLGFRKFVSGMALGFDMLAAGGYQAEGGTEGGKVGCGCSLPRSE